ncbi:MAG: glycoside hydrolase [Paludibacter sp. 47-17]|nr:MAG: glycoside hydrolase [Paludibacter sp. 47-17]
MKTIFLVFVGLLVVMFPAIGQLSPIPAVPSQLIYSKHNDDFTVSVREPGGEWQDLYEYKVMVDLDTQQPASMVQFDFKGRAELRIKVNNTIVNDVKIRPARRNIVHQQEGNIVYFNLDKPAKLSVEINGNRLNNLHIFANEPESEIPTPDSPSVMYFGPGLHRPQDQPGNAFNVPSNTTVYLAPGAYVNGKFVCNKVENVRFIGRGYIIDAERGFEITYSENIEIDGITVINPNHYTVYGGEVKGLKINNLKSFSVKGWSDGIDLMSCSEVTINDIFLRNSDDCIAIYTHRWNFHGNAHNYKITNAILWADVAHPINIGLHGDVENGGYSIENLYFGEIDILEHDEDDRNYQGAMAFSVSDHNSVRNVTFENVWVENIQEGQLFNLRVLYNNKYSNGSGREITNIHFKNISYTGYGENSSIIEGFSDEHPVKDVLFENIVINGKRAKTLEDANIKVGNHTKNIRMK